MANGNYYLNQTADSDGQFETEKWATTNTDKTQSNEGVFYMNTEDVLPTFVGRHFNGTTSDSNAAGRVINWDKYESEGYTDLEILAANQKNKERIGSALVNNVVTFGSTLFNSTAGLVWGLLDAAINWDITRLADNALTREAHKWIEDANYNNPIYQRKGFEDLNALQRLGTTEFWAQTIQSLGFTEGAIVASLLPGGILARAPRFIGMGLSSLSSSTGEGTVEALYAKDDKIKLEKTLAIDAYNRARKNIQYLPEEDRQEAYNSLENKLNIALNDIQNDGDRVGNAVLGLNIALLTITGLAEFGPLIKRGMSKARARSAKKLLEAGNIEQAISRAGKHVEGNPLTVVRRGTNGAIEEIDRVGKGIFYAKEGAKVIGRGLVEGFEEIGQGIIPSALDKYSKFNSFNDSEFNPEKRETTNNFLNAMWQSTLEAMHDQNVLSEGLSGFVTGVIGAPMIRSSRNSKGNFQSPIYLQGALHESFENIRDYNKIQGDIEVINKRLQDPNFQEFYNHLTRNIAFNEETNEAIAEDDIKKLKDSELKTIISDITLFNNVGALNNYRQMIRDISTLNDEQIDELIKETTDKDGNGPFSSNGNKDDINIVRDKLKSNADYIESQIDMYEKYSTFLDSVLPNLDSKVRENIIAAHITNEDWLQRSSELKDKIYDYYKHYQENIDSSKLESKEEFYKHSIEELNTIFKEVIRRASVLEKKEINDTITDFNRINKNIEDYSTQLENFYKDPSQYVKQRERKVERKKQEVQNNSKQDKLSRIDNATSFADIYNIEQEETEPDTPYVDAHSSKSKIAKEYIKTRSTLSVINRKSQALLKDKSVPEQVKKDIKTIINRAFDFTNDKQSIKSYNDLVNIDNSFFNSQLLQEDGKDVKPEELQKRFDAAMSLLTPIIKQADSENKKRQKFTDKQGNTLELDDTYTGTKEEEELFDFMERKSREKADDYSDIDDSIADDVPKPKPAQPNNEKKRKNKKGESGEENGEGNGFTTYTDENGVVHYVDPNSAERKQDDNSKESIKEGSGQFSGDVNIDLPEGSFYPAIYQYDLSEANPLDKNGNYKDINFVQPKYENSDKVYTYLKTKGPEGNAFEWVNNGGLKKYVEEGGKVYIGIDPEFSETQPVFFVKIGDEYKPINLSYESQEQIDKRGLTDIHRVVVEEYNKNKGNLYISPYLFTVSNIARGRLPIKVNQKFNLKDVIGTTTDPFSLSIVIDKYAMNPYSGRAYIKIKTANSNMPISVPIMPIRYKDRDLNSNNSYLDKVDTVVRNFVTEVTSFAVGLGNIEDVLKLLNKLKPYILIEDLELFVSNDVLYFAKKLRDENGNIIKKANGYDATKIIGSTDAINSRDAAVDLVNAVLGDFKFVINKDSNIFKLEEAAEAGILYCFTPSLQSQMSFYSLKAESRIAEQKPVEGNNEDSTKADEQKPNSIIQRKERKARVQQEHEVEGEIHKASNLNNNNDSNAVISMDEERNKSMDNQPREAPVESKSAALSNKEEEYINNCDFPF